MQARKINQVGNKMEALEFIKLINKKKGLYRRADGSYTIKKLIRSPVKLEGEELSLYKRYSNGAKDRGYEFNLSTDTFQRLIRSDCLYCGIGPKQKIGKITYNGIDRLNNNLGYDIENCMACCGTCNKMKGTMDREEFENHLIRIAKLLILEVEVMKTKDINKMFEVLNVRLTNAGSVSHYLSDKNQ